MMSCKSQQASDKSAEMDGEEWLIEPNVIEAQFSKAYDILLVIARDPNQIRLYDPIGKTKQIIKLKNQPSNLSISPNGKFALISAKQFLYYLDLNKLEIIQEYELPVECYDIALSDKNWAYITPKNDDEFKIVSDSTSNISTFMYAIDLKTKIIKTVGAPSKHSEEIKIHPSGKYLFSASNPTKYLPAGRYRHFQEFSNVSNPLPQNPDTLKKYDIQNGIPKFVSISSFPAASIVGEEFWFTDNGSKIITHDGVFIHLSDNIENDLKICGFFYSNRLLEWYDYSNESNTIYACLSYLYGKSLMYDFDKIDMDDIKNYKHINLPTFPDSDKNEGVAFYQSVAKYFSFNSNGTKLIILLESCHSYRELNEWKIYILDL